MDALTSHTQQVLGTLDSPRALRRLQKSQLPHLAEEIRQRILSVVSKTGGHLGGPLGAVELSIALHYVFDTPHDKIIWDTGHQSYAHKILTGRNNRFETLRQQGGLAGFCSIFESEYDVFGAGHAGTSLSAALGVAIARDLRREPHKVIAVIGDGALSSGLALEALNNISPLKTDMIIVLNDNGMSISPSTGALTNYLASSEITTPGSFFEHLGYRYEGPIDGHDINALIAAFQDAKTRHGALIMHVNTEKGNGYPFANDDAERLHGMPPFEVQTGQKIPVSGPMTYTETFGEAIESIGQNNDKIVAISAAMLSGTGLKRFQKRFPKRFFDVGIAEQHAVTFAAGLARAGMRPVCAIYSTFLQRAVDQVIHDVCLQNLPVIFALDRAGFVGDDGPTHHGTFDLAYLRMMPNMTVMVPKNERELQHMLYTATLLDGPVAIRYPRGQGIGAIRDPAFVRIPTGKAEILQQGERVLLIGVGPLLYDAQQAAKEAGLNPTIVNARFVKPLDAQLILAQAQRHERIITLEEGTLHGGLGTAIAELLHKESMNTPITMLGIPDAFIEHGKVAHQRKASGIDLAAIKAALVRSFR